MGAVEDLDGSIQWIMKAVGKIIQVTVFKLSATLNKKSQVMYNFRKQISFESEISPVSHEWHVYSSNIS